MTDQERDDMILEARRFYMVAPLVLPIIERWKKSCIDRLRLAHAEGKTDHTALVAELFAFSAIEEEINQKDQTFRSLEEQNVRKD